MPTNIKCFYMAAVLIYLLFLPPVSDVDNIINRWELSVHRQIFYYYRFLRPRKGFSAGNIELTAMYFPRLPAVIYIPASNLKISQLDGF